jgi:hypothetical protein
MDLEVWNIRYPEIKTYICAKTIIHCHPNHAIAAICFALKKQPCGWRAVQDFGSQSIAASMDPYHAISLANVKTENQVEISYTGDPGPLLALSNIFFGTMISRNRQSSFIRGSCGGMLVISGGR